MAVLAFWQSNLFSHVFIEAPLKDVWAFKGNGALVGWSLNRILLFFFPTDIAVAGAFTQPCHFRGPPQEPIPEPAARQRGHRTRSSLLWVALQDATSCDRKHAAQPDRRRGRALTPCPVTDIAACSRIVTARQPDISDLREMEGKICLQMPPGGSNTQNKKISDLILSSCFMSQELLSWPLSMPESVLLDKTVASEYDGSSFYTLY